MATPSAQIADDMLQRTDSRVSGRAIASLGQPGCAARMNQISEPSRQSGGAECVRLEQIEMPSNLDEMIQLPAIDIAVGLAYRSTRYESFRRGLNSRKAGRCFLQPPMQKSL